MDIKQAVLGAVRNLLLNKGRFAQVMLSLSVSVAAIIVVFNTCRLIVQQEDESWNPERFSVVNMYIDSRVDIDKRPTVEDLERIAAANPDLILGVSPFVTDHTMTGNVRYGDKYCKEAYFLGVNEQYADIGFLQLAEGRFIEYMDCRREQNVCVVSGDIANKLMGGDAVGKTLNIWGENFTVIGVMVEDSPDNVFNGLFFMPYTCAQKLVGEQIRTGYQNEKYYVNRFDVWVNGLDNVSKANALITEEMNKLLGSGKERWTLNAATYLFVKESITAYVISKAYNYILLALAVLLVGGVGIMNMMTACVEARTKEIGIRKAFGATAKDIRRQFRLEAIMISLLGGLVGVVLGVVLSLSVPWLISDITIGNTGMVYSMDNLQVALNALPILLALGFSVGVGVIFGVYPAQQAAKMEIVDAINEG